MRNRSKLYKPSKGRMYSSVCFRVYREQRFPVLVGDGLATHTRATFNERFPAGVHHSHGFLEQLQSDGDRKSGNEDGHVGHVFSLVWSSVMCLRGARSSYRRPTKPDFDTPLDVALFDGHIPTHWTAPNGSFLSLILFSSLLFLDYREYK